MTQRDGAAAGPSSDAQIHLPAHMNAKCPDIAAPPGLLFEALDDGNRLAWERFVAGQERASLYHDARWQDVIVGTMKQQCRSLLVRDARGKVVGVLPLYRLRSRMFGDFGVSVPYVNYGGALGQSLGVEAALMAEATKRAADDGMSHVEFRDLVRREGWSYRDDKVSMIRALPQNARALDAELGAKLRAQIKRARREDVKVRHGRGAVELDAFYRVFCRNMRDLGTPVYAKALFADVLTRWPDQAFLVVVDLGGKPAAAAFLIRHRDTLEIPWASSLREHNRAAINMLMYWEALVTAIEQGCRYFDFGRSSVDSGTYRFKRQWGAVPVQHHWHYWLPQGAEPPRLNPDNPKYRLLIELWRRMPVGLTRIVGPHIVRRLP